METYLKNNELPRLCSPADFNSRKHCDQFVYSGICGDCPAFRLNGNIRSSKSENFWLALILLTGIRLPSCMSKQHEVDRKSLKRQNS